MGGGRTWRNVLIISEPISECILMHCKFTFTTLASAQVVNLRKRSWSHPGWRCCNLFHLEPWRIPSETELTFCLASAGLTFLQLISYQPWKMTKTMRNHFCAAAMSLVTPFSPLTHSLWCGWSNFLLLRPPSLLLLPARGEKNWTMSLAVRRHILVEDLLPLMEEYISFFRTQFENKYVFYFY